jgi:hypothetical protein
MPRLQNADEQELWKASALAAIRAMGTGLWPYTVMRIADEVILAYRGRIVGWMPDRVRRGDVFQVPMASGKVGQFVAKSVDYFRDPPDMFAADVEWRIE